MRRFLIVGCGGSGGATLAYLMDQLRSDLAAAGVHTLPRGWQFVHIDVPNTSDRGPEGLGSVEEQGGTYFGCGPQAAAYSVLDAAVSKRFRENAALDAIGTWAPREPDRVTNPISDGAGQYRAVGRMISLSRASAIRELLQRVWEDLAKPDTVSELKDLSVPGLGSYDGNTPIVLVVSSMAGGAGASMALDVCRLLTLVDGLDPKLMGVFMVAPNIFDALPEASRTGVRPNALAMLGEIVASQTGAAHPHDEATFRALGQPGGSGVPIPFARVFPVGRFAGVERMQFGDGSPEAVYRGLGRGLAGMLMSENATTQFVRFDLGNVASPNGDRDLLGWGSQWSDLPWGSYGFASLSMGRDRYAEYAAQRIARSCVDRLLHGHLQPGNRASSNEQVAALLDSQWAGTCRRAGLPPVEAHFTQWLTGYAFPAATIASEARALVQRDLATRIPSPDGLQAAQWVPALRHRLAEHQAGITAGANAIAVRMAFTWHQRLLDEVEQAVAAAVADLGLPYAVAVVERMTRHAREVVAPAAGRFAAMPRPGVTDVPAKVEPMLAGLSKGKGAIPNGRLIVQELVDGCRSQVTRQIEAHAAEYVGRLMQQFAVDVLARLAEALGGAQMLLENVMTADVTDRGLARLATDQAVLWPSDADPRVPSRFDEADNEVLLTSSAAFMAQYTSDIRRAIQAAGSPHFEDARSVVVRSVISGVWETTGGQKSPGMLLVRLSEWRAAVFPDDPTTGLAIIPSHTNYDVHVRAAELLARARKFVERPGESFHQFCQLSITEFVKGAGEAQLEARRRELVTSFDTALTLARPLISVNNTALQVVHGADIEYRYKFSEVPFEGLPVADDLMRVLTTNPMIDHASQESLGQAIGDTAGVTRIDIFGSYPNYSPLVFDAVLKPVAEQWAAAGERDREPFWQWRRARPLDAALPMGIDERRAMVAGWLLGQVIGQVRIPPEPFNRPVQIWDGTSGWVSFPHPLLTPPKSFVAKYDWLPAVLESVLVAIARSHEAPVMASLRPYRLLRGLYDDSTQRPASGPHGTLSASRNIRAWLTGAGAVEGSAVAGADAAKTIDERARLATEWLATIHTLAGEHYMAPGQDGAPGYGAFSQVESREAASATPMFRDIAPDIWWATAQLTTLVEEGRMAAHDPAAMTPDRATWPTATPSKVTVPEAGTF